MYTSRSFCSHHTFATGGCDGLVSVWDKDNKKRVSQFARKYPTSISSLSFAHDGTCVAIASSYTWEEGEKPRVPSTSHSASLSLSLSSHASY